MSIKFAISRLWLILAAVAACCLAACAQPDSSSGGGERPPMTFRIRGELLGNGFMATGGIRMWTPKAWPQASQTEQDSVQEQLNAEPFLRQTTVLGVFRNPSNGARLAVTFFDENLTREQAEKAIASRYEYLAEAGGKFSVARFLHNGCAMDQLILGSDGVVRIMLFIRKGTAPLYLLDFLFPAGTFASEKAAMTSCVGTIKVEPDNPLPIGRYQEQR